MGEEWSSLSSLNTPLKILCIKMYKIVIFVTHFFLLRKSIVIFTTNKMDIDHARGARVTWSQDVHSVVQTIWYGSRTNVRRGSFGVPGPSTDRGRRGACSWWIFDTTVHDASSMYVRDAFPPFSVSRKSVFWTVACASRSGLKPVSSTVRYGGRRRRWEDESIDVSIFRPAPLPKKNCSRHLWLATRVPRRLWNA